MGSQVAQHREDLAALCGEQIRGLGSDGLGLASRVQCCGRLFDGDETFCCLGQQLCSLQRRQRRIQDRCWKYQTVDLCCCQWLLQFLVSTRQLGQAHGSSGGGQVSVVGQNGPCRLQLTGLGGLIGQPVSQIAGQLTQGQGWGNLFRAHAAERIGAYRGWFVAAQLPPDHQRADANQHTEQEGEEEQPF